MNGYLTGKVKMLHNLSLKILFRTRTAVNLYSHCFCAVITFELCKKDLDHLELGDHAHVHVDCHEDNQIPLNQLTKEVDLNEDITQV